MSRKTTLQVALYFVCFMQVITSAEKQIFDFLGYMWLPILANFLNIVFIIFCFFGLWQSRRNYIVSYVFWTCIFIMWNVFLICYYMEVGSLRTTQDLLSFNTGSFSWFMANGYGCNAEYFHNVTAVEETIRTGYYPIRPSKVTGCLLDYKMIETVHSIIHLILAALGVALACFFLLALYHEKLEKRSEHSKSIYSIEYSPQVNDLAQETQLYANTNEEVRPHMTPRRVKRRSYTRSSTRSASNAKSSSLSRNRRSSTRSLGSLPKNKSVNPVTRLITTGPVRSPDSSTSNDDTRQAEPGYGQINPAYESSRPNSIYSARGTESSRPPSALTSYSNFHGQRKVPGGYNHIGMASNQLTQESFVSRHPAVEPPPRTSSNSNQRPGAAMNSSYDDLPPPPHPAELEEANLELTSSQLPVPQQRNNVSTRKNEYVNMPIQPPLGSNSNYDDQSLNGGVYSDFSNGNAQTLEARGHLLRHEKHPAQMNGATVNGRPHRGYSTNGGGLDEDDYGFAGAATATAAAPALPPKGPTTENGHDKWYLKDSMRPVGASMHGGNCKCYRCQRKLTAI